MLVPKANFHGDPHDKSCSYFLLNKPGPSRYDQTTKSEDLKDEVREKLIANELLNITIKSSYLVSSSFYINIGMYQRCIKIFVMFSKFFLEVIFQSRYVFGPH